ncbi:hypothetical protein CHS0354_015545 [Potamilus streckersoni]|uniref:Uncharacterized protein n=1 Tax=Potamilus streckersoni TaxID=2493646 RepID=A0AAE0W8R6_9BIVA|nr:hypothetical protein CHS0354_015545 [Potamilus streckersoni]
MVTRGNSRNARHETYRSDMMNRYPHCTRNYIDTNIHGSSPYSEVQQRLRSFIFCRHGSKQNFLTFANAGFHYYDSSDSVYCPMCRLFLRDWRFCEDPLLQHIKMAPRCPVVLSLVGENIVHEFMSDESSETTQTATHRGQARTGRLEIENMLLLPAAQSVLEHGYSKETVLTAIRKMQNSGRRNFTALELLNIIFEEEEKHD